MMTLFGVQLSRENFKVAIKERNHCQGKKEERTQKKGTPLRKGDIGKGKTKNGE